MSKSGYTIPSRRFFHYAEADTLFSAGKFLPFEYNSLDISVRSFSLLFYIEVTVKTISSKLFFIAFFVTALGTESSSGIQE
jgi:hypothetical protein